MKASKLSQRPSPSVLIDASNLHVGGGVQVAASFVNELARLTGEERPVWLSNTDISVSDEVAGNLSADAEALPKLKTRNSSATRWRLPRRGNWDVAFTVFGPTYRRRVAKYEIVGLATPRLLYDLPEMGLPAMPRLEQAQSRMKRFLFGRADLLVVETDEVANRVIRQGISGSVTVVPNLASSVFSDEGSWQDCHGLDQLGGDYVYLACVARDYPHKNLKVLPKLAAHVSTKLGREVRFVVTLSDDEWHARDTEFKEKCINVGVQQVAALPSLYKACEATVLPTLLECFSATPMESMAMGRVAFVSDRPFMRAVYGDGPIYLDPLDVDQSASAISTALLSPGTMASHTATGRRLASEAPTGKTRAIEYCHHIDAAIDRRPG